MAQSTADAGPARIARAALERLLETDAPALRATLPPDLAGRAERYVALLLARNRVLNLTRVTEPDDVARLHLLDALSALAVLDRLSPTSALDLGSGGGVPGLVLALARASIRWTLVDSVAKKCDALRDFARELGLDVTVIAERAESLGRDPAHRERYEVVTARACAALPVLVEYALPLISVGGALVAWKGPLTETDPELRAGAAAARMLGGGSPTVETSGIEALGAHRFVVVRKERPTPAQYPRRPGDPSRRPLA